MKSLAVVGIMGMLLSVGAAADTQVQNKVEDVHVFRHRFACRFHHESSGKGKEATVEHNCRAFGRVFTVRRGNDDNDTIRSLMGENERDPNRLRVWCDGQWIYKDGARLRRMDNHTEVQSIPSGIATVQFGRGVFRSDDKDDRVVGAWLDVDMAYLNGHCRIDTDEVRDRKVLGEDGDDMMDSF